jgi:hypothetical protein
MTVTHTAVGQTAEVRRLADERVSRREIGRRLGLTRYMVGRILDGPGQPPDVADLPDSVADQSGRVADHGTAGDRAPAPVAGDPAALADQSGHVADSTSLVLDVGRGLAGDLADLMDTGHTAKSAVGYAVAVLAAGYRNAQQLGQLAPGDRLDVVAVTFRPPGHPYAGRPPARPPGRPAAG